MQKDPVEHKPWYNSATAIVLLSLLIPPVGLALLWYSPGFETQRKILGSLLIAAITGGYVFLAFGGVLRSSRKPDTESHYDEVERHRAQQRVSGADTSPANDGGASAAVAPAANSAVATDKTESGAKFSKSSRNYWTDFRGPNRDGRYDEMPVLKQWPETGLSPLWRQPIGGGYSSFTVAEGRAYTIEQRRRREIVAAYDLESGRELWTHAWDAEFAEEMGDGPRATPTWNEGRLYALGATGVLHCIESKSGKLVWSRDVLKENGASNLQWGTAASPLVVDNKVIVAPGGPSGRSVVAYNKVTGSPVWQSLSDRPSYTSPMLATLAGKRQVLVVTAARVVGLDVDAGTFLWGISWDTQMGINVSQPIVVNENRFFISAGYGKGAALVEITSAESGFAAKNIWQNNSMKNKFNSSVLHNGHVYGLDEGILTCVNVETGERKWKGGRYGYGQVLLAGDRLIVMSDAGELALVKAAPEQYTELSKFPALEGKCWNYPAIANGLLLVRNQTQMACYNIAAR